MSLNLYTAWIAFLLGCIAGAIPGIFFHNANWLGGYSSWKRRIIRLAHISFFGIGALNLAFALTVYMLEIKSGLVLISYLLIIGAITMPTICYLSAWICFFVTYFLSLQFQLYLVSHFSYGGYYSYENSINCNEWYTRL